jgi:CRISPR-associated protein Cas2
MYTVLAYDVEHNGQRQRLYKRLRSLLRPMQKSVFEGHVGPAEIKAIDQLVVRTLDLDRASVRLYPLCTSCRGLIRSWGDAPLPPDPRDPILFTGR